MAFDDEETQKAEERFQELLNSVRAFAKENQDSLKNNLTILLEAVERLTSKKELTKNEMEMLADIRKGMPVVIEQLRIMQGILQENLFRKSAMYYEHVKKLALEGNEDARKIYEDLKITYQAALKNNISEN